MTRQWGKGRIFERPSTRPDEGSRWYIAYCAPKDGRTAEIREVAGDSREDAEKLLVKRMREVANHRDGLRKFEGPKVERVTVDALLDDVEEDYDLQGLRSLRTAKCHMARLREALGGRRAASVTTAVVQRYILGRRSEGAAPATVDRETELLRKAFNLGARAGRVAFVPYIPHQSKPNANARQGFLERSDFDAILSGIADEDFCDLLEWFWWTGMRPGEIASLTWAAHDRETGTLRLSAAGAKIGQGRVIPLTGPLAEIIERRRERRTPACRLVFHAKGSRMVRENGGLLDRLYDAWFRACEAAGLPSRTRKVRGVAQPVPKAERLIPYDLRRTAVRNLRAAGIPERVAMEITGHKTRSMFDRYGIVDERDMRNAFEVVGAYVESLPKTRKVVRIAGADSPRVSPKRGK
jgi:integrase